MVIDYLENVHLYYPLVKGLDGAVRYLGTVVHREVGKYSDGIYTAIVQEDDTVDISLSPIEAHKQFVDLQVILSGNEGIGWNDVSKLSCIIDYDQEKDVSYYQGKTVDLWMEAGMFYLCFPTDGHKCKGLVSDTSSRCRKICVKIPV